MELIIGKKYKPIRKTIGGISLNNSLEWKQALRNNQDFLYYTGIHKHSNYHCFSAEMSIYPTGDFFDISDVILYTDTNDFAQYDKCIVTTDERVSIKPYNSITDQWTLAKEMEQPFLYYNGSYSAVEGYFKVTYAILGVNPSKGIGSLYDITKIKKYEPIYVPDKQFIYNIWLISDEEQRKIMEKKFPNVFVQLKKVIEM